MKRISLFLSVCILYLSNGTLFAQKASDYYLPLRVGNYLQFQSSDRTTTYTILRSDTISGLQYFLEKRSEVMAGTSQEIVYALFWLRNSSAGEILLGAVGASGSIDGSWSSNVDSATKYDPAGPFFSNQFIVPGYAYSYSMENYTWVDTTMSNTETVQTTAGVFTNCVKIRETKRQTSNDSLIYVEYTYYAAGKGVVRIARDGWPMSNLVGSNTATSINAENGQSSPVGFALSQNYPNPFNPSTEIQFSVEATSNSTLTLYNALGQRVAALFDGLAQKGRAYSVHLEASRFATGVYFYTLQSGSQMITRKLMLMK
jgi:hypothetical protein